MNETPRVGAKIRVARTYAGGTVIAIEGIVVAFDLDKFERVTCIHLADGMSVSLKNDTKSTVTWVELEPPKPALPPQPAVGGLVMVTDAVRGASLVYRRSGAGDYGCEYECLDGGNVPTFASWGALCLKGTPVPLVPAPDLAELVAAYRGFLEDLHARHPGSLETCDYEECVECRPLLIQHETGAAT